jgi:hypothetical protein
MDWMQIELGQSVVGEELVQGHDVVVTWQSGYRAKHSWDMIELWHDIVGSYEDRAGT